MSASCTFVHSKLWGQADEILKDASYPERAGEWVAMWSECFYNPELEKGKTVCPHFYSTPTWLGRRCSEVLSPTQLRCEAGGQWVHNLLSMASHGLGEATEGTSEPSMFLKTEMLLPCLQAWQKRPPPPQALGSAECCLCPRLPSQAWTCSVLLQVWLRCAHCTWKRKAQRKLNDELVF